MGVDEVAWQETERRPMSLLSVLYHFWRDGPWPLLALLTAFTFCLQFEPSEPYLVPYLTRIKAFTNDEVDICNLCSHVDGDC